MTAKPAKKKPKPFERLDRRDGGDGTRKALAKLGPMRPSLIKAFSEVQRKVAEHDYDLVILCARRLPCLYQVLLDSGHPGIGARLVVSDRFLDVACEWDWKNVLILDDTVVLGTTLAGLYDDVRQRVDAKFDDGTVSTYTVCLDEDRSAGYLTAHMGLDQQTRRDKDTVEQFSRGVVTTLFQNQRPFFSDFPVSAKVTMDAERFAAVATNARWAVADVTTSLVAGAHQSAFVQLPDDELAQDLLGRLPAQVRSLISAFKLRTWVTRTKSGRNVKVTFVPLALLGGAREADLDAALASLGAFVEAPELEKLRVEDLTGAAKHRLLQMFTSVYMFAAALPADVAEQLESESAWVDATYTELYFGTKAGDARAVFERLITAASTSTSKPGTDDQVAVGSRIVHPAPSDLLHDDELNELLWASRELLATASATEGPTPRPGEGEMTKVGVVASHAISSLFGYISEHFEVDQQDEIRALRDYDTYQEQFGAADARRSRVLHKAFTMTELTEALIGDSGTAAHWSRALVSLGVDIGNDLGIVVPTTLTDEVNGVVYRAYRLGETAPMARRPLLHWNPNDDGVLGLDEFSRRIAAGAPALTKNVPFALPRPPAEDDDVSMAQSSAGGVSPEVVTLVDLHRRAFPGELVAQFNGRVSSEVTDGGTFVAQLISSPELAESSINLTRAQVLDDEQDLVRVGARFRWTVWESSDGRSKKRTSSISFERPNLIAADAAERAAERFGWLAEYDSGQDDIDDFADFDEFGGPSEGAAAQQSGTGAALGAGGRA